MTRRSTFATDGAENGAIVDDDQVDGLIAAAGIAGARDILEAFWRSSDRIFAQLKEQIASRDFVEAARSAHSLKGSAMNVGAGRLSHGARALEEACRRADAATAETALGAARDCYGKTCAAFETALKARG